MKRLIAASLALAAATAVAAPLTSTTYSGRAFVRTDAHDRVVVVLDADRDGFGDHVFLFDPIEPLPQGLAPRETDVNVGVEPTSIRVTSPDGLLDLQLRAENPPAGGAASAQAMGRVAAYGRALVHRVLGDDAGAIGSIATDGMGTVIEAGEGKDDPCLNPTGCRSGGKGSVGCDVNCGGGSFNLFGSGMGVIGQGCSVACNLTAGYYSCCNCEAAGATCGCYNGAPCVSDSRGPILPQPK